MNDPAFRRYLLGELFWELERFDRTIPGLTDVPREEIEVISFSGYDSVRLRAGTALFDASLSWRGNVPPVVEKHAAEMENGGRMKRVLVVEDDDKEALRLVRLIEGCGHIAFAASRGNEAWDVAVSERPDMFIIKTDLPDMRGMELFARIREDPLLKEKVVMLANPHPTDLEIFQGFQLHSDFHWQHPLDATELTTLLGRLLK